MSLLFFAEYDQQQLSSLTLRALCAAQQMESSIDLALFGEVPEAVLAQAQKITHVKKILCAPITQPAPLHARAEDVAEFLFTLAPHYETFAAAASLLGKDVMPRLAAKLDVMQISEIVAVVDRDTFKRFIYAGNALTTVRARGKKVVTIRSSAFPYCHMQQAGSVLETIAPLPSLGLSQFIKSVPLATDYANLETARIVVAGGRGLGSKENFFSLLGPLAEKLHAALGASRAAVDAGYAPNDWQIGQTGKVITPDLYIAVAISGAAQHLAGIKDAKKIVAINCDPHAPLMHYADFAVEGDLFTLLPELTRAL